MMRWHGAATRFAALFFAVVRLAHSDLETSMQTYAPKSCKYNPIPSTLESRAFTAHTGEVHVHDVFGLPSTAKRHVLRLDVGTQSLLTVQAEVHRDTPATLSVDAYRRGEVGKPSGRILFGKNLIGSGGEDTKAFMHGLLSDKDLQIDIVFELVTVEVAASQVDSRVAEARCHPVRLDITAIPTSRAALNWPTRCPASNKLPQSLQGASGGTQVVVLDDKGLEMPPKPKPDFHYAFKFGDDRPWSGFDRALWSGTVEVPPRLHRFVRFFFRASFRFASAPLQLVLELFDLKDVPDGTALQPKCSMGCLGGVPTFNGQIIDHAMPTGFKYRLWLMAANLGEWTRVLPQRGRQCMEFDLDYSMKFEERMTPFEVGPAAWLCESARLPQRIVQMRGMSTDKLSGNEQLVAGRTIWIRDRFGFPPDEVSDMEHKIALEISEPSVFRATTHHSDGVDVFVALTRKGESLRVCKSFKHPGPVPRQSIFCLLQPGSYTLTFFADYPLGGLHPCSDFFAQVGIRPQSMYSDDQTKLCVSGASDLASLKVQRSLVSTTTPRWKAIKVPITFDSQPTSVNVWSQSFTVSEEDATKHLYLRLVLHSDYVSSDLRFQVRYEGKFIADTQVTSHGYADMIGPLDPGDYTVEMYYVTGMGGPSSMKLCSTSMADLRVVSQQTYGPGNRTSQWLCTSTRVPPPDLLAPQPEEQVLLDSEYVVPEEGKHAIRIKVTEPRLVRVKTTSADADFTLELWTRGGTEALVASGPGALEALVGQGLYSLKLKASVRGLGSTSTCSTFLLNLLIQAREALPVCPWSSRSSDRSSIAETQRGADDHIGSLLLDLVPKHLSKDTSVSPPSTLWMSQGMEKSFDMILDSSAALRLDAVVQPPWLPLEISVRKKRASGKLEAPVAVAEWTESRLLLLQSELPKGKYVVELKQPRRYTVQSGAGGDEGLANLCAHVTITAEVGVTSKEAVNTMRSELLDLPDLLAVQPLPPSLNAVGWFRSPMLPIVGTQVYRFKDSVAKTTLKVDEKAVLRVVCEPADLSNAEIAAELLQDGNSIAQSDNLGQLISEVSAGTYELAFRPKASAPFLITVGIATESRLREDYAVDDSGKPCLARIPALAQGVNFSPRGWSIGPTVVRLQSSFLGMEGVMSKVPITLASPSILYIEIGSALPLDLVRIALQVPEGLWVGEQRGMRNSLEIELPPGKYTVHIAQPRPYRIADVEHCLEFSVSMSATPISPDAVADAAEARSTDSAAGGAAAADADGSTKVELGTREEAAVEKAPCFGMGTVPLPLDISDPKGGSLIMGGPLDRDGRLLIRSHVMITDMHDGRKKVFLQMRGQSLQMKVAVTMSGYARLSHTSQLAFQVHPAGSPAATLVEPTETWSSEQGWERVYNLDGAVGGFWLTFHHEHRERTESACLHFGLFIEVHPVADTSRMISCGDLPAGAGTASPEDVFPSSLDLTQVSSKAIFRYSKPLTFVQQRQRGFLTETKFSVRSTTYVAAEVAHNFFSSHAEMDIVEDKAGGRDTPLVTAELESLHQPGHPLNAQLVLGRVLQPGDYILRVADDHYANQIGSSSACFPFSLEVRARAVNAPVGPTVMSVQPHPSVPIPRGVDLVITLRFSEPPEGSIEEVVRSFSLGGVRAVTGGSMNAMEGQYATEKRTTVQVSTAEGHLVWVIGWSAQALSQMSEAKLRITNLRSNVTKQRFNFRPATYTIGDVKGSPWRGGQAVLEGGASAAQDGAGSSVSAPTPPPAAPLASLPSSGTDGEVKPESPSGAVQLSGGGGFSVRDSDVGRPKPEGGAGGGRSSSAGGVGMPRPEAPRAAADDTPDTTSTARPVRSSAATGQVRPERPSRSSAASSAASAGYPRPDRLPPRPERQRPELPPRPPPPSVSAIQDDDADDDDVGPKVDVWDPMGYDGSRRRSAAKATTTPSSGDYTPLDGDESARTSSSTVPTGYHPITLGCGVILGAILLVYCSPKLRTLGAGGQTGSAARFKDAGARTLEEELGLLQAPDRYDDDDML